MTQNKKVIELVVSAVLAIVFVNVYLKNIQRSRESQYDMVEVLVAARDIGPHTLLNPEMLTTQQVPLKFMQPGAIMVKIPSQALSRIQGKVTIASVPAGSQLMLSNLNDPSIKDTGVAPLLPPGKRGYLLRLGNLDVSELILPGDHIDVMATLTVKTQQATSRATYTILQNVLVLGVGRELRKTNQDVSGKKEAVEGLVLTLALEPIEAERLALAQAESQGEISVVVRPHGENEIKPVPGITPEHLLG